MHRFLLKVPGLCPMVNSGIANAEKLSVPSNSQKMVPHIPPFSPVKLVKTPILEHIYLAHLTEVRLGGEGSSFCSLPPLTWTHREKKEEQE